MKTKIKRHSRSVISVLLTVCMLVSCMTVGLIATDAANMETNGSAAVGAALNGDAESEAVGASVNPDAAANGGGSEAVGASADGSEAVGAAANDSEAVGAKADDGASVGLGSKTDYAVFGSWNDWAPGSWFNGSGTTTVSLAANTTYTFKIFYNGNGNNNTEKWYGASSTFSGSQSEYYFNVSQGNATLKTSSAGTYTFTLKRVDNGDGAVNVGITFPAAATYYSITVNGSSNGTVSSNKVTATSGSYVTLTATPSRGYKLTNITVKYKSTSATVYSATSGNSHTFTMPAANVTVSATFGAATARTITANAATYGTITIRLSNGSGTIATATTTATAGATLTAYDDETLTVTASPQAGYTLSTLTRNGTPISSGATWTVSANATIAATFTKKNNPNQYTATLGSTVTGNPNLYTKVKATYFDYHTDSEVSGSWIRSIKNNTDRGRYQATCEPYTKLNTALKNYSSSSVTYPIYFGNFYGLYNGYPGVNNSTNSNFKILINNSQDSSLGGEHKSVTGLTGKTLSANGIPTYFSSSGTNQNGKEMKLFDKDWLTDTTQNGQGVLATTIDAAFPVRKDGNEYKFDSTNGRDNLYFKNLPKAPYYTMDYLYCDVHAVNDDYQNIDWYAYYYNGPEVNTGTFPKEKFVQMQWYSDTDCWRVPYDGDYKGVIFVRKQKNSGGNWNNAYNQTANLEIPDGNNKNLKYVISGWNNGTDGKMGGSWQSVNVAANTGGNTGNITLDYYGDPNNNNNSVRVFSPEYHNAGFYPFDWGHVGHQAYDLGFGVAMELKFTLGPNGKLDNGTAQKFNYSGDDDLWVFIDDNLILDLGGDHKQSEGSINFSTGYIENTQTTDAGSNVTRNERFLNWSNNTGYKFDINKHVHTLKIFYIERGMFDSNLKFSFSMYPADDLYDVEKKVDITGVNAGLADQISDTYTFTNTSENSEGANAAYTLYRSDGNSLITDSTHQDGKYTTNSNRRFSMSMDSSELTDPDEYAQYAQFKNIFTHNAWLQTTESFGGKWEYDTTYEVRDMENNSALIKSGSGANTGQFNFFTTKDGADPDLDITHLRTTFTNKLKLSSFMLYKEILDDNGNPFYDSSAEFTFMISMKDKAGHTLDASGLEYTLNGGSSTLSLAPLSSGSKVGTATIKQGDNLLFEGIPTGAKITVWEATKGSAADYVCEGSGFEQYYQLRTITADNSNNNPTYVSKANSSEHTEVTFTLNQYDTITISNKPVPRVNVTVKKETNVADDGTYFPFQVMVSTFGFITHASIDNYMFTTNIPRSADSTVPAGDPDVYFDNANGYFWLKKNVQFVIANVPKGATAQVLEMDVWDGEFESNQTTAVFTYDPASSSVEDAVSYSQLDDDTGFRNILIGGNDVSVTIVNRIDAVSYEIVYKYPSRPHVYVPNQWEPNFGKDLSYTVKGQGTESEIVETVSGTKRLKQTIIQNNTPYEKNFMRDISWVYNNSYVTYGTKTVDGKTVYTATVTAKNGDIPSKNLTIFFPYEVDTYDVYHYNNNTDSNRAGTIWGPVDNVPTRTSDYYSTGAFYYGREYQSNIAVAKLQKVNGKDTTVYESTFAAPALSDGSKFLYWSIRARNLNKAKLATTGDYPFEEVARSYDPKFMYTIFDNYEVYAIYEGDPTADTSSQGKEEDKYTYINFLDYSRNQWNENGWGTATDSSYPHYEEGDIVWTDFDVSFENGYAMINQNNNTEVGILVERLDLIEDAHKLNPDSRETGYSYANEYQYYVNKYASSLPTAKTNVIDFLKSSANTQNNAQGNFKYSRKIINKSDLTNKNRTEYGYGIFVRNAKDVVDGEGNITTSGERTVLKDSLYRAYSYIKVKNADNTYSIVLCETPVYFSVQNEANKTSK